MLFLLELSFTVEDKRLAFVGSFSCDVDFSPAHNRMLHLHIKSLHSLYSTSKTLVPTRSFWLLLSQIGSLPWGPHATFKWPNSSQNCHQQLQVRTVASVTSNLALWKPRIVGSYQFNVANQQIMKTLQQQPVYIVAGHNFPTDNTTRLPFGLWYYSSGLNSQ